jgi:broad specificity phosphatase PhoE
MRAVALYLSIILLGSAANAAGLIIMRHGEAEHNVLHIFNADPTSPQYRAIHLTEKGKAQVKETATKISKLGLNNQNVRTIYVSPLPRTIETASILIGELSIPKTKLIVSENIIENRVGKLEGTSEDEFNKIYGAGNRSQAHRYGGETDDDVAKRVDILLNKILDECKKESYVVIVSHGTPSKLMLEYLIHKIPNGGLNTGGYIEIPWEDIYANFLQKCH